LLGRSAPPAAPPEAALVCQCNAVPRGRLVDAWRTGARTVEDFAQATRASTGCGGCAADLLELSRSLEASAPH
jgi:assimilatory nitrate reductase electron transfer subunit